MGLRTWTREKEDYLQDNYGKYPVKKLAKKLGFTEIAIQVKAKRLGLKLKNIIAGENYYTQQEIVREAKSKGIYLTRDIILSLINNKIITKYQFKDKSFVYFSEKDKAFILNWFSKYELLMSLNARLKGKGLKLKNTRSLHDLLTKNSPDPRIEIKQLDGFKVLFISLESSKFIENLLLNYITKRDFAQQVYYSISAIHHLISINILTSIKFANKHWIHKNMIEKIKYHYEPRKNQYR